LIEYFPAYIWIFSKISLRIPQECIFYLVIRSATSWSRFFDISKAYDVDRRESCKLFSWLTWNCVKILILFCFSGHSDNAETQKLTHVWMCERFQFLAMSIYTVLQWNLIPDPSCWMSLFGMGMVIIFLFIYIYKYF